MASPAEASEKDIQAMQGKIFSMVQSSVVLAAVAVADKIKLFEVLYNNSSAEAGKFLTVDDIAKIGNYNRRYIIEILGSLGGAGFVEYDESSDGFAINAVQSKMFADENSTVSGGFWTDLVPGYYRAIPGVAEAAMNPDKITGVPFSECCSWGCGRGIERLGLASVKQLYVPKWFPESMPEWVSRLEAGIAVADIGCGTGLLTSLLAAAYPASKVTGVDRDAWSIERAKTIREDLPNLTFICDDLGKLSPGSFDLIVNHDCIHDLAQPAEALAAVRRALKPGGVFFSMEPKVPGESTQEMMALAKEGPEKGFMVGMWYGISTLHCMTVSLAQGGVGLGCATFGPKTYGGLAKDAGFVNFEVVGGTALNNFYKLTAPGEVQS